MQKQCDSRSVWNRGSHEWMAASNARLITPNEIPVWCPVQEMRFDNFVDGLARLILYCLFILLPMAFFSGLLAVSISFVLGDWCYVLKCIFFCFCRLVSTPNKKNYSVRFYFLFLHARARSELWCKTHIYTKYRSFGLPSHYVFNIKFSHWRTLAHQPQPALHF